MSTRFCGCVPVAALLVWPATASALVPVYCATDDLHERAEFAGNAQTIEIMDEVPCDLGNTTLLLDESTSIIANAGISPTITGSADPMIQIMHADVGAVVTLEALTLVTLGGQTAVAIDNADVVLHDVTIRSDGGVDRPAVQVGAGLAGILLDGLIVRDFSVVAPGAPGGLDIQAGSVVDVVDSWFDTLNGNTGGAIRSQDATLTVRRTLFCHLNANAGGAGVWAEGGILMLQNNLFLDNAGGTVATVNVGGSGSAEIRNNHFVANVAGGVTLDGPSDPVLDSNLFLLNASVAAEVAAGSGAQVDFNLWFGNTTPFGGELTAPGPSGILGVDPEVVDWPSVEPECSRVDLRPRNDTVVSPLIDAGNPLGTFDDDMSGSGDRNDIGAYGGPERGTNWDDRDADGDPYTTDCDDQDAAFATGAVDVCDADDFDQDCSGLGDDDPSQFLTLHPDADGDGYGDRRATAAFVGCPEDAPPNWLTDDSDCNDAEPMANPGVAEVCDFLDNDCSGAIDDAPDDEPSWGPDADSDGWGTATGAVSACRQPAGFAPFSPPDCDDTDPWVHPAGVEICDGNDTDCDPQTAEDPLAELGWYPDDDGDAFGLDTAPTSLQCASPGPNTSPYADDCDDTNPAVYLGAREICDTLDNDCDGLADDEDPEGAADAPVWYPDLDGDGLGDAFARGIAACTTPPDRVDNAQDCDDEVAGDGGLSAWWPDADTDGFGDDRLEGVVACVPLEGWVDNGDDCADWLSASNPAAPEVPDDGLDNNCDGFIDEMEVPDPGEPGTPSRQTDPPLAAGCTCGSTPSAAHLGWLAFLAAYGSTRRAVRARR